MMDWNDLSNKLKSLGVKSGKDFVKKPERNTKFTIEKIVPGNFVETIFGPIFCATNTFPINYRHGQSSLYPTTALTSLSRWAHTSQVLTSSIPNIIFLDTETTGLSGGTGTLAFMVGVGKFIDNQFVVNQYFMRNPAEEMALLAGLTQFMNPLEAIVTYNGKSFDVPLLRTRYIINAMDFPIVSSSHFDLLHLARRLWQQRLPSCSLSIIEHQILGVIREEEEVPGYAIPELYTEFLRTGDARPMHGIFYHNLVDILSLAGLFTHTAAMLESPSINTLESPEDLAAVGKVFQSLGDNELAISLYTESLQSEKNDQIFWKTLQEAALIYKRQNDYQRAIAYWEKAAYAGFNYACEELAKYYEHHARDLQRAIHWTKFGLELIEKEDGHDLNNHLARTSFTIRLERLVQKNLRHNPITDE